MTNQPQEPDIHLEEIQHSDLVNVQMLVKMKYPSTENYNRGSSGAGNCTIRLLSPKSKCQIIQIHIIQVGPLLGPVLLSIHFDNFKMAQQRAAAYTRS